MSGSSSSLEKPYRVQAVCHIELGMQCVLDFPSHNDHSSYWDHVNLHNQQGTIVGLNEETVDIRMKTGAFAGKIVHNVPTMNLVLLGTFQKVTAEVEEPHF